MWGVAVGEHVAFAIDSAGLLLVVLALWLLAQRRSLAGIAFAILGLACLAGMTALRALPSPTRQELTASVGDLNEQLMATHAKVRTLVKENAEIEKEKAEVQQRLAVAEATRRSLEIGAFERVMDVASSGHYSIRMHPDDEWIEGQRGRYYVVRLHNALARQPFVFPRGEYRIEPSGAIREAFEKFQFEVLGRLPSAWTMQLLLRGGATTEPLVSTTALMGVEFGAVRHRLPNAAGRYGTLGDPLSFPTQPTNEHLPLLRAAEYRRMLFSREASETIELLHREPAGTGEEERVVEIVMYVKPN